MKLTIRPFWSGLICGAVLVPSPRAAVAQGTPRAPALTDQLGVSANVKVGTLANGLRYYIRQNGLPAKRAELRLVVNAGSILEDDNQLGYAHFVEHTAFNGTQHFKKNDLVKYLESIGVRFGADLNASTSFDETIYQLSVPTDTAKLIESAFLILEDWAHGQTFDSTEVVGERGVILEEWRGRLGAGDRMMRASQPIVLKGSRYATRLPIGTESSITGAQPSGLRRFYTDWYRPDLMAVVAVGDFDPVVIEGLIKTHFAAIKKPTSPRPRVNAAVPSNAAPLIAIVSDAEATGSVIQISYKHASHHVQTVGDYRERIKQRLYFSMINARLSEIAQKPNAPFLGAGVSSGGFFSRSVEALSMGAAVKDGGIEQGLESVLLEARRVDQFGFLPSELQRAKDNLLRSYERSYAERSRTTSDALVRELVGNFLEGEDIPGIEAEYAIVKALMPGVDVSEVNKVARDWITDENRVVQVNMPKKAGVVQPTEAQLMAVLDRVSKAALQAYTETVTAEPLLDITPKAGKVLSSTTNAATGITEWKLSNGARVLVKPTDFKADEVLFTAYSPGGTSLVPDADYLSASNASAIMSLSGVGRFSAVDLGKKLAGKAVSVNTTISSTSEGLSGSASSKDLETMMQLIYLRFTEPRVDSAAWMSAKARTEAALANRSASPQVAFSDSLTAIMSQHSVRARPLTAALLNEIDPRKALTVYRDRFANAGDFTFVLVGNVVLDSLKPFVEKYFASLPATGRIETWKDLGDGPPTGIIERDVRKGTEPQSATAIIFTGPVAYSPKSRLELNALTTIAQIWLTNALREEMGATYSPSLGGGSSRVPRQEYQIFIQFTSAPDNVDKLVKRTFGMIDSLKRSGPSDADMTKIKEQILRSRETSLKTNSYWLTSIASRDQAAEDAAGLLGEYDEMVKQLTPAQLMRAANQYFDMKRYVKVVLLPEAPKP